MAPSSGVDGLYKVYLKVLLKMCLNVFWNFSNLVFCLSIVVSDFVFLWILLVCMFGVSLLCLCFSVSPIPCLSVCLYLFWLIHYFIGLFAF